MSKAANRAQRRRTRRIDLHLDQFAWEALDAESVRLGVSVEELLEFSLLYYLADADSGRIAREITRSPHRRRP